MKDLKRKIIDISYKNKSSHIGSCLTAVNTIEAIYELKKPTDKFILSCGHANLALQVVLKEKGLIKKIPKDTHPDRLTQSCVDCSTGSLGQGLPIAVGMALARKDETVYCLISDGECSEGSIWEALRIASENGLTNLKIYCNANGWGAYKSIVVEDLIDRFRAFGWGVIPVDDKKEEIMAATTQAPPNVPIIVLVQTDVEQYPFLKGQGAHYVTITQEDYEKI
jgi:transketolase